MDTDYSEYPLSWNLHERDVVDSDHLVDHHHLEEAEEDVIAEWTVEWIVEWIEVDHEEVQ